MKNLIIKAIAATLMLSTLSGCYVAPAPAVVYGAPAYYPYYYPPPAYFSVGIGGHGYWRHR